MGASERDLGYGQSDDSHPRHPRVVKVDPRGTAAIRRGHEPVPGDCGQRCRRASGHRGKDRAARPATNAYTADAPPLPRDLSEAVRAFRTSEMAVKWFGPEFVDHYACTREWEVRQYQRAVTDWELARYFEAV